MRSIFLQTNLKLSDLDLDCRPVESTVQGTAGIAVASPQ